jgi:hypothetical protein
VPQVRFKECFSTRGDIQMEIGILHAVKGIGLDEFTAVLNPEMAQYRVN